MRAGVRVSSGLCGRRKGFKAKISAIFTHESSPHRTLITSTPQPPLVPKQFLRKAPGDLEGRLERARALVEAGEGKRAQQELRGLLDENPGDAEVRVLSV